MEDYEALCQVPRLCCHVMKKARNNRKCFGGFITVINHIYCSFMTFSNWCDKLSTQVSPALIQTNGQIKSTLNISIFRSSKCGRIAPTAAVTPTEGALPLAEEQTIIFVSQVRVAYNQQKLLYVYLKHIHYLLFFANPKVSTYPDNYYYPGQYNTYPPRRRAKSLSSLPYINDNQTGYHNNAGSGYGYANKFM